MKQLNRKILGFYDNKKCGEYAHTQLYRLVEFPLNYLGFMIDYVDVNEEPSKIKGILKKYSRIIFWLEDIGNEKQGLVKDYCKDKNVLQLDDSFIGRDKEDRMYWKINPLKFFEKVFESEKLPKIDVSIINGNRIFFSNIDGDLFCGKSSLEKFNGEIILNEVLKKYPLPFTASLVVSEIENNKELIDLAKKVFLLDNVEGASHSFFHPSDWQKEGNNIDLTKEIDSSVDYINKYIASPRKSIKIFLWPGFGNPTKEGLEKVYKLKIKNINGGWNVVRSCRHDPLCFLPPYTYKLGNYVQYNSRSLNESSFSRKPAKESRFSKIIDVFTKTDNSNFTLPINLYFHWYSGNNENNLMELIKVLNWVSKQDITPLFTTEYVELMEDFLYAQIFEDKKGYVIKNKGNIRTIRFDNCNKHINFKKSKNIIGYCHRKNNLYVFFNEGKNHRIELQDGEPNASYLRNANRVIKNWSIKNGKITFRIDGQGLFKFEVAINPGKYLLKIKNKRGEECVIESQDNVLSYSAEINNPSKVSIKPLKDSINQIERINSINKWSRVMGLNDVFYLPEKVKFSLNTAKADCRVVEGKEIIRISTEEMPKEEFNQLALHESAHILKSKLKKNHLTAFRKRVPSIRKRIKKYHKIAKNSGDKISPLNYLLREDEIFARLLNYVTIKGRQDYKKEKGEKPWHLIDTFNNKDAKSVLQVLSQEFQEAYKNNRLREYFNKISQTTSNCMVMKSLKDIKDYKLFFTEEVFKKNSEKEIEKTLDWLKRNNIYRVYLHSDKRLKYDTFKEITCMLKKNKFKITLLTDGLLNNRILDNADFKVLTDCVIDLKDLNYSQKDMAILKKNLSSLENTFIRIGIRHDFPISQKIKKEFLNILKSYSIQQMIINLIIRKNKKSIIKKQFPNFIDYIKNLTKQKIRVNLEGNLPYCCLPKKEATFLKKKGVNFLKNNPLICSDLKIYSGGTNKNSRKITEFNTIKELYQKYKKEMEKSKQDFFKKCQKCIYKRRNLC